MNWLKFFLAGATIGVVLVALRDTDNQRRPGAALAGGAAGGENDEEEPVLGYDGMDEDTLLEWLDDAELDPDTLERIHAYEEQHLARESILAAIEDRF